MLSSSFKIQNAGLNSRALLKKKDPIGINLKRAE